MGRVLSYAEARRFYDHFGSRQDNQGWYEDRALDVLVEKAEFQQASRVFEFGCGTGRLAERLLRDALGETAQYVGVDVSSTMLRLAGERLAPWPSRAKVLPSDGTIHLDQEAGTFDRFVSTYVLDLLSEDDIRRAIAEARRLLRPGGRLCTAGITSGATPISKLIMGAWRAVHRLSPKLVGGCRPISVSYFLSPTQWRQDYRQTITSYGVSSEVVIASRLADA